MPTYRLQPVRAGRYWWAVFGVTAVVLLLPVILNLAVPDRSSATEEVRLSAQGYSWEVPIPDPEEPGEPLTCGTSAGSITGQAWDCGGAALESVIAAGGEDPDHTLWRMTRALSLTDPPEDAPILREGDSRLLINHGTGALGLSLEGSGDHDGLTMVAVLSGDGLRTAPIANAVWQAYTGRPLPELVLAEILALEDPLSNWGEVGALTLEGINV